MSIIINTDVEVFLDEIETEDLIEELNNRGIMEDENSKELLNSIWMKRRLGNHDYQSELDQLIYKNLGHII